MFEAKTSYAKIAYEAILYYLTTGNTKDKDSEISTDLKLKIPCFVAIFDAQNNLMGIAGSTEFKSNNLLEEITEKAIQAAINGTTNSPVTISELSNLKTEVYLLSSVSKLDSTDELKPQKDGLALTTDQNKYFILPDVDNSFFQCLNISRHKWEQQDNQRIGGSGYHDQTICNCDQKKPSVLLRPEISE